MANSPEILTLNGFSPVWIPTINLNYLKEKLWDWNLFDLRRWVFNEPGCVKLLWQISQRNGLSPVCSFICCTNIQACSNFCLHSEHWYNSDCLCTNMCSASKLVCLNSLKHSGHVIGSLSVCVFWCMASELAFKNPLLQISHWKGLFDRWDFMWTISELDCVKDLSQLL